MSFWTEEREAETKRRFMEGESAGQIARALGTTRNTILGKLSRLGLSRSAEEKTAARSRSGRVGAAITRAPAKVKEAAFVTPPKLPPAPPPPPPPPPPLSAPPLARRPAVVTDGKPVRLEDLDSRGCKWPIGETEDPAFGFCGRPRPEKVPYCDLHERRAYVPGAKRAS